MPNTMTIDQTNYIQRGNISGHWATYFSGPNFLKVGSFMGQPYEPQQQFR